MDEAQKGTHRCVAESATDCIMPRISMIRAKAESAPAGGEETIRYVSTIPPPPKKGKRSRRRLQGVNRPLLHKLVWAVGVFLFPIIGIIIYWLYSNREARNQGAGYEPIA